MPQKRKKSKKRDTFVNENETKYCQKCKKIMKWKKKWENDWENIKYCSKNCKKAAKLDKKIIQYSKNIKILHMKDEASQRSLSGMCYHYNKIYIFGGVGDSKCLNDFYCLDSMCMYTVLLILCQYM